MSTPLLLLDFDGVIADSLDFVMATIVAAGRRQNCAVLTDVDRVLALLDGNFYAQLATAGVPAETRAAVMADVAASDDAALTAVGLVPGMKELLWQVSARYLLGIVSSNRTRFLQNFAARHRLPPLVRVLGGDTQPSKVTKIRDCVAALQPTRCIYVGDTRGDMLEAREAGVMAVGVTWGWHDAARLAAANPDALVDSPEALAALLVRLSTAR
jgi:phosphoglycolate phosphatase